MHEKKYSGFFKGRFDNFTFYKCVWAIDEKSAKAKLRFLFEDDNVELLYLTPLVKKPIERKN